MTLPSPYGPAAPPGPLAPRGAAAATALADKATGVVTASPPARSARAWHAELAWLPGLGVLPNVLIEATGDRFSAVTAAVSADAVPAGTIRLAGLTMPGLANGHSHAFHRALRGTAGSRGQRGPAADPGPAADGWGRHVRDAGVPQV